MADVFLLIKNPSEQRKIIDIVEDSIAFLSDDQLNIYKYDNIERSLEFIESDNKLDVAIVEVKDNKDINFLSSFRKINQNVEFMLLASATISPMKYLTPRIRPTTLLLTPYDNEQLKDTIVDYLSDYYNRREDVSDEKKFVINTKDGKEFIPFSSIYYIEVREKRVYIRLQNKEYSQFGTLENILTSFPEYFIRCHRSYAFNTKMLSSVKFSENVIFLNHGITVPLSRSYKKEVKEHLSGK